MVAWANQQPASAGACCIRCGPASCWARHAGLCCKIHTPQAISPACLPSACTPPAPSCPPGWVVLELPAGRLTLDKPLKLTRAQTVLRGAGAKRTTLYLPNSFTDLYGGWRSVGKEKIPAGCLAAPAPCPVPFPLWAGCASHDRQNAEATWHARASLASLASPASVVCAGRSDAKEGGYIFWGAFITAEGKLRSSRLARVTSTPGRGAYALQVRPQMHPGAAAAGGAAAAAAGVLLLLLAPPLLPSCLPLALPGQRCSAHHHHHGADSRQHDACSARPACLPACSACLPACLLGLPAYRTCRTSLASRWDC